jgi:hypothetical protein
MCACAWKDITDIAWQIVFGVNNKLYPISLITGLVKKLYFITSSEYIRLSRIIEFV